MKVLLVILIANLMLAGIASARVPQSGSRVADRWQKIFMSKIVKKQLSPLVLLMATHAVSNHDSSHIPTAQLLLLNLVTEESKMPDRDSRGERDDSPDGKPGRGDQKGDHSDIDRSQPPKETVATKM